MLDLNLEINKLRNCINNSKKIILINHRRMDWDTIWSLSAFYYILKNKWYDVKAINDELTPEMFNFLNDEEIFNNNLDLNNYNPDLIISFDVSWINQFWEIYEKNLDIFNNTTFVVIDHHLSNTAFWNINIIDINASSTCEIVWNIIKNFWWEKYIDSKISTFLLTWIITDTNSFLNTNTTSKTLYSASELMNYNPRHNDIVTNLFKKKTFNKIKLWWKILNNLKNTNDWKIIWNIIPKSLFIETWTTDNDISWLIDEFLMTIDTIEIWFLLYELDNKKIKWSFRWKNTKISLNEFCEKWWWWWHRLASWFIIEWKEINEIEQEVIKELINLIK